MGEREIVGVAGLGALFLLLGLRVPVGLAMALVGIGGNYALSLVVPYFPFVPYVRQFKTLLWNSVANYDLSVVPLFVLMGFLASRAGLAQALFDGVASLLRRVRGGGALAAVGACAGFGAVCGSSLATASAMGRIALPELARLRYAPWFAAGTLAAGGTLGILVPPSVALVVYAIIVEASILDMFRAAVLPALVAVGFFLAVVAVMVRLRPDIAPPGAAPAPGERRRALLGLVPVAAIFATLIVGLGLGLFTPTPAAGVGVALVLAYGLLRRGGLDRGAVRDSLLDTAVTAGMIYFILFGAEVLKGFFTRSGLPAALAAWAAESGIDPWLALALMLAALVVLGCFMESLAMILVVVPFLWPTLIVLNGGEAVAPGAASFGLGTEELKIWFGILALVVVELGLITPPVGLNVFVIAQLARETTMAAVFRGVVPFLGVEVVRVALLVLFPALTLLVPRLVAGW